MYSNETNNIVLYCIQVFLVSIRLKCTIVHDIIFCFTCVQYMYIYINTSVEERHCEHTELNVHPCKRIPTIAVPVKSSCGDFLPGQGMYTVSLIYYINTVHKVKICFYKIRACFISIYM